MSYAGATGARAPKRRPPAARTGRPSTPETDWAQVAIFGAGLALGIALGASAALLSAPQTGQEARSGLRQFTVRKRRAIGRRSRNAWLDLRDELRDAAASLARRRAEKRRQRALEAEEEAAAFDG